MVGSVLEVAMKYLIPLMIFLFLLPAIVMASTEAQAVDLLVSADAWAIESVWTRHVSLRFAFEMRHGSGIGVQVPLSLILDRTGGGEALLETAVNLVCLPWGSGPFISLALAKISMFVGPFVPQDRIHYVNEIALGYSWEFLPGWFVQPSVVYRDPSDGHAESHAYVQALVPSYQKFRFCLDIGRKFATILPGT
jgi:hypothetical protein